MIQWRHLDSRSRRSIARIFSILTKVIIVPYTGTCNLGKRLRKSFFFVGSPDLQKLLWHVLSLECEEELVTVGPKGIGKSCRLRAIASMFYAGGPQKSVIVCVWNMEKARTPLQLLKWLLDGLRFAYSGADEHKPVRDAVHKMEEEMEEDGDFNVPGNIEKWMEALDTRHHSGIERAGDRELENTFLTLKAIVEPYKVVWGVSPTAHQVTANLSDSEQVVVYRVRGFNKRTKDMDFYAGFHPQFLDELDAACMEIARIKQLGRCEPSIEWVDGNNFKLAPPAELEPKEVCILLVDEEDWHRVLLQFINGRTMSSIRNTRSFERPGAVASPSRIKCQREETRFEAPQDSVHQDLEINVPRSICHGLKACVAKTITILRSDVSTALDAVHGVEGEVADPGTWEKTINPSMGYAVQKLAG
ncbi:hypothetical protein SELMODRAFT_412012 [Selaginella moellendorffii]|uniref:Uncharacterized protein n=1 Tax=Selaginella moellendorffii TaxID=88036 RepID=D8RJS1_SELML|nr:hypothetical protein SELMODRAFT_412012 [Selaginella moellendorffii]